MNDKLNIIVAPLSFPEPPKGTITKDDVWGKVDLKTHTRLTDGMIIARHEEKCPHFNDIVGYKSVTIKGLASQVELISYWAEYVHGADCISAVDVVGEHVFIRSDYQCW